MIPRPALFALLLRLEAARATAAARLRAACGSVQTRFPRLTRRRLLLVGILTPVALTLWAGIFLAVDVVSRLPDPHARSSLGSMPEATLVYDASGELAFTFHREQRIRVPIERVSPHLLDAVLAVEDRRFYEHGGIDLVRVLGAALANVSAGRIVEGGSTITQQLARQSLLTRERSLGRKLAEVLTASWMEQVYDKREILELYLNEIYWGAGLYGVEAAARGYFAKPASELSVSEAALLAGLIRAPEGYSPRRFPDRAVARRDVVLDVLLSTSVIDETTYHQARREPLRLKSSLEGLANDGDYFEETVRQELAAMFGSDRVHAGGLRVHATIDPETQRAAEKALEEGLQEIEARSTYRQPVRDAGAGADYLQGALIALDPVSGEVRALVGGRDFSESPFNRATHAHRQPGSAFKPILYAAAVDQGVSPTTLLDELDRPVPSEEGAWLPAEGHEEASALTVRAALRVSSNRAAVRLLELTGIERAVDYAGRFGLGPQPPVPSLALGSGSATLESLTAAYAAFANGGTVPQPTYITRVTDSGGNVLFEAAGGGRRAIEPATAFVVANLLRGVLDAGTGWSVRRNGFRAPAAGKTGTTDDYKDAWFIGFTPALAAGVWIGFDEPRTIVSRGYGADLAAPVWARFMSEAPSGKDAEGWIEPPPGVVRVEVCASSLVVATDACRRSTGGPDEGGKRARAPTYPEYFVSGSEPLEPCPIHRSTLAYVIHPLRSWGRRAPRRHDRERPPATRLEPRPPAERTAESLRSSVPVIHDHIFGSCAGLLVAGAEGFRYVTAHKDAFTIDYEALASVVIDVDERLVRLSVRGGRSYNFAAASPDASALAALEAALLER